MDITLEKIEEYKKEGIDGLLKVLRDNPIIKNMLDNKNNINPELAKGIIETVYFTDREFSTRFVAVSSECFFDVLAEELLSDKQPEQPEPDFVQLSVDYFRKSKYYKAWLETDTGTEGGLTGAVLIAYALDGKFNELFRKAGLNCSSSVARVIVTRLLEQKK